MQFNSYTFILFFALVLFLHHLPFSWKIKKTNLLWASYLFYAAWNPPFVVLIWISTLTDWVVAKQIYHARTQNTRRLLLAVSLAVNLGMLGFFKYGNFLLDNFIVLMGAVGVTYQPPDMGIILPIGISFYTFQTLSYTLDIYMKKTRPWGSFLDYALYVTFFPQLVAGPIVRAHEFLPQCEEPARASADRMGWGLSLLILGLFEKVVLADGLLAPITESVYEASGQVSASAALGASLAFTVQIYCDFAGYSTCAIGAALCLGFSLPDNFRLPFAAVGFSDFWQRWHISLSTWLRDYLYIPLGGSKKGTPRTFMNMMITMLLGGLWHGAAWTYVCWGAMHGIYLAAETTIVKLVPDSALWQKPFVRFLLALLTFWLFCLSVVVFRSHSFSQACMLISAMAGFGPLPEVFMDSSKLLAVMITVVSVILLHWYMRDRSLEDTVSRVPWPARAVCLAIMIASIIMMPGDDYAFIYFQF